MSKLDQVTLTAYSDELNKMAKFCHDANSKWWFDEEGYRLKRNKGEMIALMHSELSEMLEGERKDTMDSHLPHRKSAEVELVDLFIRAFDYAGAHGLDIGGAFKEKMNYNATRADHSYEERAKAGGKKF